MTLLPLIYLVGSILATFISYVALNEENKGFGLYFYEWLWCFFIGALWPIFLVLFIYQHRKEAKRKKDNKPGPCGCGCGKQAKE